MRTPFTALAAVAAILLAASPADGLAPEAIRGETLSSSPTSPGQTGGGLTLEQVVARALRLNPSLAAATHAVSAAEARVTQAGLLPNPELELELENFGGSGELDGFGAVETTVVISQPILLGGKRGRRQDLAESESLLAEHDLEAARLDVVAESTSAFFCVLAAQQREALSEELLGLAERLSHTVQMRVEAGKVSPVEATRAGIEVAQARVRRARAARSLGAARALLAATWGSSTPTFGPVAGELPEPTTPPALGQLIPLLTEAPELVRLEGRIERRRRVLALEKASGIPDLRVSLGPRRFEDIGRTAWVAGLSVPIPIFDRNQGSREAARFEVERSLRDADAVRVALEAGLTAAHERLRAAALEAASMDSEVVPGATAAFAATERGYSEGKFEFLYVLDAQQALFEALSLRLDSREEYALVRTEVERLIGDPLPAADASDRAKGDQR